MAVRETQTGIISVVAPSTQIARMTQTGLLAVLVPSTAVVRMTQTAMIVVKEYVPPPSAGGSPTRFKHL